MKIERPEMLREWLTITLKECSDADPDALGKYILALLKKDNKKDLKTFLLKQLQIFLQHETSSFVELLLETLQTKSYIKETTVPNEEAIKLSLPCFPTRCKHYDEKGFCLRGNFCCFDHGSDPILLDEYTSHQFLTSLNSVNYGCLPSDKYEGCTESPRPLLLPPPLPPPLTIPPLPPPLTIPPLPPPLILPPLPLPTEDFMENSQNEEGRTVNNPLNSVSVNNTEHFKTKRLDFSRLNPYHRNIVNTKPSLSKGSMPRTVAYTSNLPPQLEKKVFPKLIGATKKRTQVREELQLGITTHKIKLHQAKTQLVTKLVTQQKLILEKRIKSTKKAEKIVLKKALDIISQKLEDLTKDFEKENKELKSLLFACLKYTSPKVSVSKIAAKAVDHQPKTIFVAIEKSTDKEDLKKHFKHFGEIETWEETSGGVIVSFYTGEAAEAAFFHGTKFEDSILSLSWFNDTQLNISNYNSDSNKKPEQKTIEMILDEEEENEEARFWRH